MDVTGTEIALDLGTRHALSGGRLRRCAFAFAVSFLSSIVIFGDLVSFRRRAELKTVFFLVSFALF